MRSPQEIRTIIERRLKNYISRDRTGIRRALLTLFLRLKSLTIAQIFEALNRQFSISYHSVAAMVGIIASKIGILHVTKNKEGTYSVYSLKEQYIDTVERIIGAG
jgi:predicted transcriptional regulator